VGDSSDSDDHTDPATGGGRAGAISLDGGSGGGRSLDVGRQLSADQPASVSGAVENNSKEGTEIGGARGGEVTNPQQLRVNSKHSIM